MHQAAVGQWKTGRLSLSWRLLSPTDGSLLQLLAVQSDCSCPASGQPRGHTVVDNLEVRVKPTKYKHKYIHTRFVQLLWIDIQSKFHAIAFKVSCGNPDTMFPSWRRCVRTPQALIASAAFLFDVRLFHRMFLSTSATDSQDFKCMTGPLSL